MIFLKIELITPGTALKGRTISSGDIMNRVKEDRKAPGQNSPYL